MCRRLILASGIEGVDGFRQRWSLHGRLTDSKYVNLILAFPYKCIFISLLRFSLKYFQNSIKTSDCQLYLNEPSLKFFQTNDDSIV